MFCNVFRINICSYINHLQLGILLKENTQLKNDTVLFLREKHNFCRGALKMILKNPPFNFGRYLAHNQASYRTISFI